MSTARQAAAEAIHAVCEQGDSLDDALNRFGEAVGDKEKSLFRALSYGGVREYLAYKKELTQQLKKPFKPKDRILNAVLISALYQLDETEHAPYAIVNEAVELAKQFKRQWAAGLVNAILRNRIRAAGQQPDKRSAKAIRNNYPEWLIKQIDHAWPEHLDTLLKASQARPPLTLRVNRQKNSRDAYLEQLNQAGIDAITCEDSPSGLSITRPVPVENIPGFSLGTVSVQDESAQLAAPLLDLQPGQRVLDACAAPGGKSLHILDLQPKLALLQVLDLAVRLPRLQENFQRTGAQAEIIAGSLLSAEEWWDGIAYDRILLDVPCTGTGVMRRHPDIKLRRQAENGLQFAAKQLDLLNHAWQMLKPDGKLLYTTCSILPIENQQCIEKFLQQNEDASNLPLPKELGLKTSHGRQRLTGVHPGDGFFYALIHKK